MHTINPCLTELTSINLDFLTSDNSHKTVEKGTRSESKTESKNYPRCRSVCQPKGRFLWISKHFVDKSLPKNTDNISDQVGIQMALVIQIGQISNELDKTEEYLVDESRILSRTLPTGEFGRIHLIRIIHVMNWPFHSAVQLLSASENNVNGMSRPVTIHNTYVGHDPRLFPGTC